MSFKVVIEGVAVAMALLWSAASAQTDTHQPASSFSLAIAVPQATFKSGSDVHVTATITNTSDRPATYIIVANSPQYAVFVRDSDGKPAPETDFGKTVHPWSPSYSPSAGSHLAMRAVFGPGERKTAELDVSQQYDLSRPGEYTVQVESKQAGAVLKSNSIKLTITP